RAQGNDPAARRRPQLQHVAPREFRIPVLLVGAARKCPPAARRSAAPEISAGSPSRNADRAHLVGLSEIRVGLHAEVFPCGAPVCLAARAPPPPAEGPASVQVHPSGDDAPDPGPYPEALTDYPP